MGSEIGVEKVKRKQLQRTGPQVKIPVGLSEVANLSGPYHSDAKVTKALGRSDWVATPRFVLLRGSKAKPRVIDECKSSGLNSSFSSIFGCKIWTVSL